MSKIILKGIDYSAPVSANGNDYSVCVTAAENSEKVVDCNGFMLMPGAKITVKFVIANTADNPTLNVNNTGAKPICCKGIPISPEMLAENSTYSFRYNNNQYDVVGDIFSGDYNELKNKPEPVRIKGDAEIEYRSGNVNITPENIGLGNVQNVSASDQTPTFTQSSTRKNIVSGDKMSTIMGKIMKWFTDLKAVAFSGNYSDLNNKPSIPAAVAVKGNAESSYRTGNVNITPASIGLGNVNNTADSNKSVNYAASAGIANSVAYANVSGRPTFSLSGTTLHINF